MNSKLRKKILDKLDTEIIVKEAQEQIDANDSDYAEKITLLLLEKIKIKGLED